jgi:hypothetical protein
MEKRIVVLSAGVEKKEILKQACCSGSQSRT